MAYRNYSVANGFTVAQDGSGDFTTIAAALTAASSGMDIFIRPGSYTENLTLKAGVNLIGFSGDESTPNVTIIGKLTYTVAGRCSISNIRLQTNSDFFLSVTGTLNSILYINNCYLNCTNNTGINLTTTGASSLVNVSNCKGNLGTTGIGLFTKSSSGDFQINYSNITNSGGSTTTSTISAGTFTFNYSVFGFPTAISGATTGSFLYNNIFSNNTTCIAITGTANINITFSEIQSGTASSISVGAGTTASVIETNLNTSNTIAIAGSGNLGYGNVTMPTTGSFSGTLSLFPINTSPPNAASGRVLTSTGPNTSPTWQNPLFVFVQSQTASNSASLTFTNLNVYSVYYVAIRGMGPAVVNTQLQMQVSIDNGATFVSVGYANGINYSSYNSATVNNINSTTYIPLSSNMYNSNTFVCNFFLYNTSIGNPVSLIGQGSWRDNALGTSTGSYIGQGPTGVNAIRFIYSSGNIVTGTISLYGVTS